MLYKRKVTLIHYMMLTKGLMMLPYENFLSCFIFAFNVPFFLQFIHWIYLLVCKFFWVTWHFVGFVGWSLFWSTCLQASWDYIFILQKLCCKVLLPHRSCTCAYHFVLMTAHFWFPFLFTVPYLINPFSQYVMMLIIILLNLLDLMRFWIWGESRYR